MNKASPADGSVGTIVRPGVLIVGILLVAANMRAPIVGLAPLLDMIRSSLSLGTYEAGLLTTLPLLAFAIASPFCAPLSRAYGLERSLFGALVLVTAGAVLRGLGLRWALFAGTAIIGLGIAIASVLLPGLVKRDFPRHVAALTSAYALTAGLAAAFTSAVAVPLALHPGSAWNWSLGAFAVFPILAIAAWSPQLSLRTLSLPEAAASHNGTGVWRSVLAWQVTAFFGLNSLVYYAVVAWLPTILAQAGFSPQLAGSFHGVSQFATAVPGLLLASLINRTGDQKLLATATALITAVSLVGLLLLPHLALVWAVLFGFGTGATFILGLAFIGLRTRSVPQAAALSGMMQCVGYSIAAAAPPLVGLLHDWSGGWSMPLELCAVLCGVMALSGFAGRRPRRID